MKVFNVSIMLTVHLNYSLLFLSLFASVCSYPSTPLNERNQEISWEAWLLVDDQNQHRQAHDGQPPRRRITPKSVFVAPTFSPENLPPCAEGYSSDSMGRCIKIIKLDEDRHLEFLVSKLNAEFGSSLDYETMLDFEDPKSQPTRVEIPVISDYEDDYSNDTPQEDLDMAIIVTPTTRDSTKTKADDNSKLGKRVDKLDDDIYEEELRKLLKLSTTTKKYDDVTTRDEPYQSTISQPEESQTITSTSNVAEESTIIPTEADLDTTTLVATTGKITVEKMSQLQNDQQEIIDTTPDDVTTTSEFTTDNPSTTEETTEIISSTGKVSTTTPKVTTYHPVATTYHPYIDLSLLETNSRTKNLIRFPDEDLTMPRSHPDGKFVRFPDVDTKYQHESLAHHTRDVDDQTGNVFNEIVTPQPSQRVHEIILPPKGIAKGYFSAFNPNNPGGTYSKFFPSKGDAESFEKSHGPLVKNQHLQYHTATTEKHPLRKSKDKHGNILILPPKWPSEDYHKPIVIRFSRKHFHLNSNKFKNSEFYRSLPMDDLTYLFGYKNGQTSHR